MDWCRFLCVFYVVFGHAYKVSSFYFQTSTQLWDDVVCIVLQRGNILSKQHVQISQYETGGVRDRDEHFEEGLYIYKAVAIGYHWYQSFQYLFDFLDH